MKVGQERIFNHYFPHLSEEEVLSTLEYCKRVLARADVISKEEFDDICFFFYDNDKDLAIEGLREIIEMYQKEYMRRRLN